MHVALAHVEDPLLLASACMEDDLAAVQDAVLVVERLEGGAVALVEDALAVQPPLRVVVDGLLEVDALVEEHVLADGNTVTEVPLRRNPVIVHDLALAVQLAVLVVQDEAGIVLVTLQAEAMAHAHLIVDLPSNARALCDAVHAVAELLGAVRPEVLRFDDIAVRAIGIVILLRHETAMTEAVVVGGVDVQCSLAVLLGPLAVAPVLLAQVPAGLLLERAVGEEEPLEAVLLVHVVPCLLHELAALEDGVAPIALTLNPVALLHLLTL